MSLSARHGPAYTGKYFEVYEKEEEEEEEEQEEDSDDDEGDDSDDPIYASEDEQNNYGFA
jgi:hypothetical protein